jgi:hypothetical protein
MGKFREFNGQLGFRIELGRLILSGLGENELKILMDSHLGL